MKKIRNFLGNKIFIHIMVILGFAALYGFIATGDKYLMLCIALSFAGSICGSFIKVIDKIEQ